MEKQWLKYMMIFLIILTILIIGLLGYDYTKIFRLKKVNWVETHGLVTRSHVVSSTHSPYFKYPISQHKPSICFTYKYNTAEYKGCSKYQYKHSRKSAATINALYTPNAEITVYVNPNNPLESYIDKSNISYNSVFTNTITIFVIIGVAAIVLNN